MEPDTSDSGIELERLFDVYVGQVVHALTKAGSRKRFCRLKFEVCVSGCL